MSVFLHASITMTYPHVDSLLEPRCPYHCLQSSLAQRDRVLMVFTTFEVDNLSMIDTPQSFVEPEKGHIITIRRSGTNPIGGTGVNIYLYHCCLRHAHPYNVYHKPSHLTVGLSLPYLRDIGFVAKDRVVSRRRRSCSRSGCSKTTTS